MPPRVLTESSIRRAERKLREADPLMGRLVDRHGRCPLAAAPDKDRFSALALSIVSQQLSSKAAEAISRRLLDLTGRLTARSLLDADEADLRLVGLSGSKTRYLRNLAAAVRSGSLDLEALCAMDDEAVVERLTSVSGIGLWTAQMFLIFTLKRPDVLSLGDAGLRRAARAIYGAEIERVSDAWRPYRSVASWYLWRHLDS